MEITILITNEELKLPIDKLYNICGCRALQTIAEKIDEKKNK